MSEASPDLIQALRRLTGAETRLKIGQAPAGYDAWVIADLARLSGQRVCVVVRDAPRLDELSRALAFFASSLDIISIPAWDCLPYDRVSPQASLMAQRLAGLARAAQLEGQPHIVLMTISSALQRLPSRAHIAEHVFSARPGNAISSEALTNYLALNGFTRSATVREAGEYAVRGGIIDLFPPGEDMPYRLDFFGDTLESIRLFDPESQKTSGQTTCLDLVPAGEVLLDAAAITRFRQGYVRLFGGQASGDGLYETISAGQRVAGMEHWLPLFHEKLETVFDHLGGGLWVLGHQTDEASDERLAQIDDYYTARHEAMAAQKFNASPIRPCPVEMLYLSLDEWKQNCASVRQRLMSPFSLADHKEHLNLPAKPCRNFAAERAQGDINIFDCLIEHLGAQTKAGKQIVIDCLSDGARSRMAGLIADHGFENQRLIETRSELENLKAGVLGLTAIGLSNGFATDGLLIIGEQDILGDRMIRAGKRKRADNFLTEASSLQIGDIVVHIDHGIGRFEGLETVSVTGAPHECLRLIYHDNARLFLPVENIELLSRYGGDDATVMLDRLGGQAWQNRKARLKERLNLIADKLIQIAAERSLHDADRFMPMAGLYEEFSARFPYEETEDQFDAIEAVIEDLARGRPMDRLICGDVGFGKTEIALRAAQIVALGGAQVALIAPTTLLARQHARNFRARFAGMPVNIGELSRMVDSKTASDTRAGLTSGQVDIVVGTHALLSDSIAFKRLGLVIVDEEQHFGVAHKEKLKELRTNVHVLTLTATPIPRTLQMALSGVRDLSIIATPPVDRLAIRTYITPFDGVILREALLREKYRAGQSFFIVPRIADLPEIEEFLAENVPEVRYVVAHGQMTGSDLEDRMSAFYDGQYDVLVSTSIIESGLDIPTANTMIIHRADMFGLAQLYQMRGRVGRSKQRAYAYLTYSVSKPLTPAAEKRLEILQSLDSLGAGFTLASHDLDMRGAGNLVGDEQSGHIREVGYELYQSLLEEAVANRQGVQVKESWSPQINLGIPVMISEAYVPDLELRMALYRRLSMLDQDEQIEGFAAELIDRFGKLPQDTDNLIEIVKIKLQSYHLNIAKIDVGPKGVVVTFRNNEFAAPEALIDFIGRQSHRVKVRPDQTLFMRDTLEKLDDRIPALKALMAALNGLLPEGGPIQNQSKSE